MLLGVVSDTHGHVRHTLAAVRMLESLEVDAVVHCGDIGSAEIPKLFSQWPAHFVFGNVDRDHRHLQEAIRKCGLMGHGMIGRLQMEGRSIAFLHGHDERLLRETIASGRYALVCSGHTHEADKHEVGATLALNPGAVHRANPHTLAVVELPKLEATIVEID